MHYFKQAPAHEALLTRLKTDGASGCSVAPETNMGSAKPSRVQATLGFFLKDKSGQASFLGSPSLLPASGVSARGRKYLLSLPLPGFAFT